MLEVDDWAGGGGRLADQAEDVVSYTGYLLHARASPLTLAWTGEPRPLPHFSIRLAGGPGGPPSHFLLKATSPQSRDVLFPHILPYNG